MLKLILSQSDCKSLLDKKEDSRIYIDLKITNVSITRHDNSEYIFNWTLIPIKYIENSCPVGERLDLTHIKCMVGFHNIHLERQKIVIDPVPYRLVKLNEKHNQFIYKHGDNKKIRKIKQYAAAGDSVVLETLSSKKTINTNDVRVFIKFHICIAMKNAMGLMKFYPKVSITSLISDTKEKIGNIRKKLFVLNNTSLTKMLDAIHKNIEKIEVRFDKFSKNQTLFGSLRKECLLKTQGEHILGIKDDLQRLLNKLQDPNQKTASGKDTLTQVKQQLDYAVEALKFLELSTPELKLFTGSEDYFIFRSKYFLINKDPIPNQSLLTTENPSLKGKNFGGLNYTSQNSKDSVVKDTMCRQRLKKLKQSFKLFGNNAKCRNGKGATYGRLGNYFLNNAYSTICKWGLARNWVGINTAFSLVKSAIIKYFSSYN
ncbi:hypothetical protein CDIK_3661 [Cucumispora dikerogammari]|nr:hypothetical protein CDIK_3661 [Cucumispora dikerogammari]